MEESGFNVPASNLLTIQNSSLLQVGTDTKVVSPLSSPVRKPISPLGDESVQGYLSDTKPKYHGAKEIVSVVHTIEALNTSCCIVGEAALIYYGAKRMMFDWLICVPTTDLNRVDEALKTQPDRYEAFRPSALNVFGSLNPRFPRYKVVGQSIFFMLFSSRACHLDPVPQNIEYDRWIRIPYPKLPVYTQSLLDTWNTTDLEDLIDGMNLDVAWGDTMLHLEGTIDEAWACWRESFLAERELTEDETPRWSEPKRGIWEKLVSSEAKQKRQGWKVMPDHLTRFWISGQDDPRLKFKDYS